MADDTPKSPAPGPFDVRTVKQLVGLMAQNDLSEIELRDGAQRLRIRRGATHTVVSGLTPAPMVMPAAAPAAPAATPSKNDAPAPAAKPAKNLLEIKSETVGTFYAKPNPDAQPFVSIGSRVNPNTVVCLIEAMKIYNEIQAGVAGTVTEILVENGQPVEFGQVLFRVDPSV